MPVYNAAAYLPDSIASIVNQSYPDWELIVVDDRSTDGSPEIIDTFARRDGRIRCIRRAENSGGPAAPRNIGMKHTAGDFVAFLDADDLWHPQKLAVQLRFMREHGAAFCFTDVATFRKRPSIDRLMKTVIRYDDVRHTVVDHAKLLRKNVIKSGSTVVVRRDILDGMTFDERPAYRAVEDYLLWLTLHQHRVARSHWIKTELVFYRITPSGISRTKGRMVKKNLMLYREYTVDGKPLGLKRYAYVFTYLLFSVYREALFAVKRAWRMLGSERQT